MADIKEIKKQIRAWNKLKKKSRKGTQQRREFNRKIRELNKILKTKINMTPEKAELIKKIYKARPILTTLKIDLGKFTIEQLEYHYRTKVLKEGK